MFWELYGQKVDLSSFVKVHPGGEIALLLGCDRDCTTLFEQYHPNTKKSRQKLFNLTGIIAPTLSLFQEELFFEASSIKGGTKATWTHTAHCLVFGIFTFLFWKTWLEGKLYSLFLWPIFHWLLAVNVAHDASHFAFSRYPVINHCLSMVSSPLFFNTAHWHLQHNISHHGSTNEVGKDIDVSHFLPLARLHIKQRWRPQFKVQSLLIIVSFFFTTIAETLIFPFFTTCKKRQLGSNHIQKVLRIESSLQLLSTAFTIVYPFFFFQLKKALLFSFCPLALSSVIFMSVTQISHIHLETQQEKDKGWCINQIESSIDYGQGCWLTTLLTGGLNMQGLHHSLPFLSSSRFQEFYPTYRMLCKKHGVKIIESTGFIDSFFKYMIHVDRLSLEN